LPLDLFKTTVSEGRVSKAQRAHQFESYS